MKRTPEDCQNMAEIRQAIDELDKELVLMLKLRADYIDRAAAIKASIQWPARIDARVEEVAMNARHNAKCVGLDPDFAEKLWRDMIEWSIAREEENLGAIG